LRARSPSPRAGLPDREGGFGRRRRRRRAQAQDIFFTDHRTDETSDKGAFIRFDEWSRTGRSRPSSSTSSRLQGRHGPQDHRRLEERGEGRAADVRHRGALHAVAPGRVGRLKTFATLPFIQSIDPSIKHEAIKPSEISTLKDEKGQNNKNPDRAWCEGTGVTACIRSNYKLEGKLPIGVALANKLRDSERSCPTRSSSRARCGCCPRPMSTRTA
jgi:hypothetical protein